MNGSPDDAARAPTAGRRRALPIRLLLGTLLGASLLAWFLATVQWAELRSTLREVHLLPVFLAALSMVGEFVLRTFRWRIVLRHVAPKSTFAGLFSCNVIGAAANTRPLISRPTPRRFAWC